MSHDGKPKSKRTAIWVTVLTVGHVLAAIVGYVEFFRVGSEHIHPREAEAREPKPSVFVEILNRVRREFRTAKLARQKGEVADFKALDQQFDLLKAYGPENPHVLYFEAEIRRLKDPAHFSAEGCLSLAQNDTIDLKAVHTLLYSYLEAARPQVAKLAVKSTDADACYANENGACVQRVAWVAHLLANDFYELGLRAKDEIVAWGFFKRANEHAASAKQYHPADGAVGFAQCVDSVALEAKALTKMRELQPYAVMSQTPSTGGQ